MKNKIHRYLGALVLILSVLYLLPFVNVYRGGDEGFLLTGAQRILRGEVIYRDFYHFLTPGAFVFLAGLFKIFGVHFLTARIATLITGALLTTLTYLLAEKLLRNRYLALLPAFMLLVAGFPDWFIYSHHWLSSLSSLLAVYFLLLGEKATCSSSQTIPATRHQGIWFFLFSGLSAALTLTFMQNRGIFILLALGVYLLFFTYKRPSKIIAFASGTLLGLGILFIYLLKAGTLKSFFLYTLIWPFTHYTTANAVPYFNLGKEFLWESLAQQKESLLHPSLSNFLGLLFYSSESLFLLTLGYLFIPAIPAAFFVAVTLRKKEPSSEEASLLYLFSLSSAALFLSSWHRPDIFHLIDVSSLPLILFMYFIQKGVPSIRLFHRTEKPGIFLIWRGIALALVILLLGINTISRAEDHVLKRYRYPYYAIDSPRGRQWTSSSSIAQDYNLLLSYLKTQLKPQEPFFALYQQSMVYFLSGTYNPTPIDHFYPEHDNQETLEGVMETIRQKQVRYVLRDYYQEDIIAGKYASAYPHAPFEVFKRDPLSRYIQESYRPVIISNHFTLYQRKD